ncbi:TauD/TfdA family dioxygenase [Sphingobium nicotianae]|uniref:TauD/TfdA family dioxygenase n=1 Tax=Sphingobium nicotianae TaxID=2782607 RepID=A0A9X1AK63_9SPHN|nr:TauD/TfdA family dioxygenase [Sphingobium nicotianae]MBT2185805.1 TauD/TfdA family dioxygenase [Sphingobium nicotianae]
MADIDTAPERARERVGSSEEQPAAWSATNGGGAEGITRRLGIVQLDAIDAAVRATEGRETTTITRADFGAPEITALMDAARYDIIQGRGAVLLSGIDISRYSVDQFARIHFGLGAHLGRAAEQSERHDRIGYVRKEPNPEKRGYLSDTELGPHTDYHGILSLASVVTSEEGGVSGFVSAAAVYDVIRRERPDLLEALEEGYYYPTGLDSVTDYKVPTFSVIDGHIGVYAYVLFIVRAAMIRGEPVPAKFVEALRFFNTVARRPELMASFTMQPGEIAYWHNFRVLHSRTSFRNTPGRERLLLRLWLHPRDHFPLAKGFYEISDILDQQHAQGFSMVGNTEELLRGAYELMRG